MKLKKLKLKNYRCFGEIEQIIDINDMTLFIGNNSTGKTAALSALNCMFSEYSSDRILVRRDFHFPKNEMPEKIEKQELSIETVFEFDELADDDSGDSGKNAIPIFFKSMVVSEMGGMPYLRIRLEATWEKSSSIEGAIDSKIYYITCPEETTISDDDKQLASRKELDQIRVLYVPAVRDPEKQLRNTSGSMMYRMMNNVNWSDSTRDNIRRTIEELNFHFMEEPGVSILNKSISSQWKSYDSDARYSDANLRFNSTDMESAIKKTEVVFQPTETGKEYTIDQMGDGLRSLFYISLVDSILDVEMSMRKKYEEDSQNSSFQGIPPVLTIVALEEPENHISPHLIGKLIKNLNRVAKKPNSQTIITSHSPAIVRRIEPKDLRYFRLDREYDATAVQKITLPDEEEKAEQYKFVKEAVRAYPELYFSKLVILGEGDSEEILLPKFWEAINPDIDTSGISIVPLGGRHVNHFWRLLSDLKIPYITLLDLDRERQGGDWGRIKYVLEQLLAIGYEKEEILKTKRGMMTEKELKEMDTWDVTQTDCMISWITSLEKYHVFFSSPLDIDFLMLEHYGDYYKKNLSSKEGPRFMEKVGETGKKKLVKTAEGGEITEAFCERIQAAVRATLKKCGKTGETYTLEQQKLMIWYSYFFLQRGKPTTHIEVISRLSRKELKKSMPPVFEKLIKDAENLLWES